MGFFNFFKSKPIEETLQTANDELPEMPENDDSEM